MGNIYHLYTTYILPSGGLYATYHLLREPGNSIEKCPSLGDFESNAQVRSLVHWVPCCPCPWLWVKASLPHDWESLQVSIKSNVFSLEGSLEKRQAKKKGWSYLWLWCVGWVFGLVRFFSDFCLWVGSGIAGWLLVTLYHSLRWLLDRVTLERRPWRWRQGSPWYQGFQWQERSPPWFSIRQAPSPSLAWTWQRCGSTSCEFMKYIGFRCWTPTHFFNIFFIFG